MPISIRRPSLVNHNTRPTIRVEPLDSNPGALAAQLYLPANLAESTALVVVLHGCTQDGVDYADAAGWLALADRDGFAVLIPQQQRSNNANLCFNWFEPGDTARERGEASSIRAMINWTAQHHPIDTTRIFVTGLSAGAAMAGTMLATYPEVFAGGGLIAGLPHGVATSVAGALQQMRSGPRETGEQLAARVRAASTYKGNWPRVSIFHGTADHTVAPVNGNATLAQWLAVHGLSVAAPIVEHDAKFCKRSWLNASGLIQVEHTEVSRMGHGAPIDTRGSPAFGRPAPYVLDVGVGSSQALIDFWGIARVTDAAEAQATNVQATVTLDPVPRMNATPRFAHQTIVGETGVEKVINDALRAAGLLK